MSSNSWYNMSIGDKNINNNETVIVKKMIDKNNNENLLNDKWVLWCHDIKDSNWKKESYIKVYSFNTIEDFWKLYKNLTSIDNVMLFLMKDGIFPLWEDEKNKNGGAWSYKIKKNQNFDIWKNLSMALVGGWITDDNNLYKDITGISINPHLYTSVVKIWCSSNNYKDNLKLLNNFKFIGDLEPIYKIHNINNINN
jgi:hypothetical protein